MAGTVEAKKNAKRKRSPREDLVIKAAAELFPKYGIEPVKMTDVAEKAGVGVASLYRYFDTKVNLALAAGALLWRQFNEHFADNLTSEFDRKTGFEQMEELLGLYTLMYRSRPEFIAFLDDLDHMVLVTNPGDDRLVAYDVEVMKFYPLFTSSFERGVADGTIREEVDFQLFYVTASHALMGVAQKLIRGEVVPSDDFSQGWVELQMAVDMSLSYLRK